MKTKKFDDFLEEYTLDVDNKAAVEQYGKQLDASILLTELCEREGYTQKELAVLSGKSPTTIARIESGNMNDTVETLADIVRSKGHQLELRVV